MVVFTNIREKFNQAKQLMMSKSVVQHQKAAILVFIKNNNTFVSPVYIFSLAGNIIV